MYVGVSAISYALRYSGHDLNAGELQHSVACGLFVRVHGASIVLRICDRKTCMHEYLCHVCVCLQCLHTARIHLRTCMHAMNSLLHCTWCV